MYVVHIKPVDILWLFFGYVFLRILKPFPSVNRIQFEWIFLNVWKFEFYLVKIKKMRIGKSLMTTI